MLLGITRLNKNKILPTQPSDVFLCMTVFTFMHRVISSEKIQTVLISYYFLSSK